MALKVSKKAIVSTLAATTVASLVGVSIMCITSIDDTQQSVAKENHTVTASQANKSILEGEGIQNMELIDSTHDDDLLQVIDAGVSVKAPETMMSAKEVLHVSHAKKIEINHGSNYNAKYHNSLVKALDKYKVDYQQGKRLTMHTFSKEVKLSLPINPSMLVNDDKVVGVVVHQNNQDDTNAAKTSLTMRFFWTRGGSVIAQSDKDISLG